MMIPFDNSYARLPDQFFARQMPAQVPDPQLICANLELADELGIDREWLASKDGIATAAGNLVPDGAEPLAQAYAGHQFGGFVPQLGDGRALLLGELVSRDGKRRDLQLKGSGRTAFSRGGDGKAALGPVLREYLVSEAMHALGVPTTRALAAVTTGESVLRQEGPLPGAVLTRVASSHIRVGTFQYFFARGDIDAVRLLADHAMARHYPAAAEDEQKYLEFFRNVIAAQADLIARWMSIGFIHGVMNTDNCAISGETIDYGPCAFMDAFHPQCVYSAIDTGGRYAWANQPDIALWNLMRLADTLLPLFAEDPAEAKELAEGALALFPERFGATYLDRFRAKLALPDEAPADLVKRCLELLANQEVDFTLFFRRLTAVAAGGEKGLLDSMFPSPDGFRSWFADWQTAADVGGLLGSMRQANPVIIPRNHRIEQAIQRANEGDFSVFKRLHEGLRSPYDERPEFADLESAPEPHEIVHQTFCGT